MRMSDRVDHEVRVLIEDMRKYDEIDEQIAQTALTLLDSDGPKAAIQEMRRAFE